MSALTTRELVTHLQHRAGDALRSVGHYNADDWGIEYVREDVKAQHSTEEVEEIIEDLRWQAFKKGQTEANYNIGELECSIQVFEHGLVMNFPEPDQAGGMFVTLDSDAARQLVGFVQDIQQRIE